jgi:PAS domain S-box-containing protein
MNQPHVSAKILLVDDLKPNLLALEGLLRSEGLEIIEAQSGAMALELMIEHEFALALIDVQMPLMNGFELAELMRGVSKTKSIPIIFVTATSDDRSHLFRGYESGAVDFLLKPLDGYAVKSKVAIFVELYLQKKKLGAAEAKFRGLLEMAPDAIVIVNARNEIEYINRKAEILFGYDRGEIIGQLIEYLMPMRFRRLYGTLSKDYPSGLCGLRKDGSEFAMDVSLSPLETEQGPLVSAAIRDVSMRRSADQAQELLLIELRNTQAELERALKVRDEFLATLSHELRTPLTAILSWAQLLVRGGLDAMRTRRAVEIIERSAKAQGQLIDDLLDVVRIQSGKLGIEKQFVNPKIIVGAAIDSIREVAEFKSIRITTQIDPKIENIFADPSRLQQILWNLISNAIKFSSPNGKIWVTLDSLGDSPESRIQLCVRDQGRGIKPEFIPVIFERFTQADCTQTRAYGGLGLGLAIVRTLVELHGWTIKVQSAGEGEGASFTILMPECPVDSLSLSLNAQSDDHAKPISPDLLAGVRLLVVDDDENSREVFTYMLQLFGAEVRTADSVLQALAILKQFKPNVLVSDIAMANESGYDLMRKVRALSSPLSDIPALALTAFAGEDQVRQMRQAGFQAHLAKPVEVNRLIIAVAQLAKRPQ